MSQEQANVCDLEVGHIHQCLLVSDAEIKTTKNGDPYLTATLQDATGSLRCVQWNTDTAPEPGLYLVDGFVETYRGELQVKANWMEPAEGPVDEFVRGSEFDRQTLAHDFERILENLDGEVGDVVRCIFDAETIEQFLSSPAATKNHHAYRRGLAEHTLSMCRLAERVHEHYMDLYGPGTVDIDLLLAGALLHDLGKIVELKDESGTFSYGIDGELVGHIAEGVCMIHDACLATLASERTRRRLLHMVLSHHGKKEYGSPVEPKLLEAMLLHQIDMMDSRCSMFREATDGLSEGELSEKVWALGGRVTR